MFSTKWSDYTAPTRNPSPPRAYSTSEEPIPDFEVENCLIALPSYLFGWVVREAESHGLTESEFLAHFLIQHVPLYELREPAESITGCSTIPAVQVPPAEPDLTDTISSLHARFGEPTLVTLYLVEEAS
jgi:hypothetical protein